MSALLRRFRFWLLQMIAGRDLGVAINLRLNVPLDVSLGGAGIMECDKPTLVRGCRFVVTAPPAYVANPDRFDACIDINTGRVTATPPPDWR